VYHGVASSSKAKREAFLERAKRSIESGKPWEEKAILSTSASRSMSEDWIGQKGVAGGGVLMRIRAKSGVAISTFTGLSGQQEILQAPGTKYKVSKISEEKNNEGRKVTILDLEEM
jgi:hypothetical protein